jgi:hypothetical protein
MRRWIWTVAAIAIAGLGYSVARALLVPTGTSPAAPMPWMITVQDDGLSEVFGITLGRTSLRQLLALSPNDNEVAIIADQQERANLEVYLPSFSVGPLTGKLVGSIDVAPAQLLQMMETADRATFLASGSRQFMLNATDLQTAMNLPVRTLDFIPSVNLEEATLINLFGEPGRNVSYDNGTRLLMYPDKGLIISAHPKAKEVFHYIAPVNFSLLESAISTDSVPE